MSVGYIVVIVLNTMKTGLSVTQCGYIAVPMFSPQKLVKLLAWVQGSPLNEHIETGPTASMGTGTSRYLY